jgi:hypothetical protein
MLHTAITGMLTAFLIAPPCTFSSPACMCPAQCNPRCSNSRLCVCARGLKRRRDSSRFV